MLDLSFTDHHLASLCGSVVHERDGVVITRWPDLPDAWSGNALWLPKTPEAGKLRGLLGRFDATFEDPEIRHAAFHWDGLPLSKAARQEAGELGMYWLSALAMRLDQAPPQRESPFVLRPIKGVLELAAMETLDHLADASEQSGTSPGYQRFKAGLRLHWRRWLQAGQATWWGAFEDGVLVGQCGVVSTPWGARLQAVTTHPDHRRKGVCTALITAVARQAILEDGAEALHIAVDPSGPALGIYKRLGFRAAGWQRSLILSLEEPRLVRQELPADHALVESLVRAAFASQEGGGAAEVRLLRDLRAAPDSLSLVVEIAGEVHGQALFTRIHVQPEAGGQWPAMALGPVSVRPDQQRAGLGRLLVETGLRTLERQGEPTCFLVGEPTLYGRFGFEDAGEAGFFAKWKLPPGALQVRGPRPGPPGLVAYAEAFDETL